MEINYQGHKRRREEVLGTWRQIAELFNNGAPVEEICKRFNNPKTGKAYTRSHIYYVLRELRNEPKN